MKDTIGVFDGEYHWLSNFWPAKIHYEGIDYPSVEHAYQAAKCFFISEKKMIAKLETASMAKRAGREITVQPNWDSKRIKVMWELIRIKFSIANPELRDKLIKLVGFELIEGNTWGDVFWGVCKGKGRNMLGKLLMQRLDELLKEA